MPTKPAWAALRHRVEYLVFRAVGAMLGALPVETASNLSGRIWRLGAPRLRRHARALANLARAFPDLPARDREAIARAMWDNLGRTFAESFHLDAIVRQGRVTYENEDVLAAWAARSGGKIACAGHLANWELAILGISQHGAKPWSIYRAASNPLVDAAILGMRRSLYTGGLMAKGPALPRQFMRLVRDGETAAFLADQRDNGGIAVPLFGRPAPSTVFPALLARTVQAPILMVRMRRLPGVRFVQSFELVPAIVTADRQADIAATTALVQSAFERYIRAAPEQWMWAHRRWG